MAEAIRILDHRGRAVDPKPTRKSGSATVIYAGQIEDLDLNPEVRGELWYGDGNSLGKGQQMMTDGHVRKSVEAVVDPILSATWDFEPASKEPLDLEVADACRHAFIDELDFENMLEQGTKGYVRDGAAYFEETDDVVPTPRGRFPSLGRTMVAPTGMHHIPMWSIREFHQRKDRPECLGRIKQWVNGSDAEEPGPRDVDIEKGDLLLRLTWQQEGADFTGSAPLRSAWGPFKIKRILKTISMIRHQREGAGIPELTYPDQPTAEEKRIGHNILKKMLVHEQGFLELPNGFSFRFATTNGQSTGLAEAEEQCNRDIAYNLGVAWMLLGISGKTGSWALASEQKGHYLLSLEKHARFWSRVFSRGRDGWSPVRRFVTQNFGPDVSAPKLIARDMPTRDWSKVLSLLPALIKTGAVRIDAPLRAMLRTIMRFGPEDESTLEDRVAPDPSLQDELLGDDADAQDDEREQFFNLARENAERIQAFVTRLEQLERGARFANERAPGGRGSRSRTEAPA